MRSLITGGAGFIGSHLAEVLLERGDEVYVIDDLSTGSILNIEHLKTNPEFNYTIDSVMNYPLTAELVDRCDVIFHLAAAVGVNLIVEDPVRTISTNIRGTEIVLELSAKKQKKVVLASTSEVYGKTPKVPFCEGDDLVLGPTNMGRWSYACSKAMDEFLAIAWWKQYSLPVVIVRLFNTVGPRQTGRYGMVIPRLIEQALAGVPITVYGSGEQSRSFAYVKDIVDAIVKLSEAERAVGEIFNLGSDEEITIGSLARRVKEAAGSDSEIVNISYDEAYEEGFEDVLRRVPDITKAREYIGFEPKVKLAGILRKTVEYMKQEL